MTHFYILNLHHYMGITAQQEQIVEQTGFSRVLLNKMLLEQAQQEQIVEQKPLSHLLPLQPPLFFSSKGASKGDPPFMTFYPCSRPCFSLPRALPRAIRLFILLFLDCISKSKWFSSPKLLTDLLMNSVFMSISVSRRHKTGVCSRICSCFSII